MSVIGGDGPIAESAAKCHCISQGHDHTPGACPNIATESDGYCMPCHERAEIEATDANLVPVGDTVQARALPPAYGTGRYGEGPYGGGSSQFVGVEARGEVGSFAPAVDVGLGGVEAKGVAAGFAPNVSPRTGAVTLSSDPPTVGIGRIIEVTDTATAVGTVTPAPIAAVWERPGVDLRALIGTTEQFLLGLKAFAEAEAANAATIDRAHNNPPGLVDQSDILNIEIALAALSILPQKIVEQAPDRATLELIWLGIKAGLRVVAEFGSRFSQLGSRVAANQYVHNVLDSASKSFGNSIGTPQGLVGWATIACTVGYGIAYGPEAEIKFLADLVHAVVSGSGL